MIIVSVQLWSHATGKVTELARMEICHEGANESGRIRDYSCRTLRGRSTADLNNRFTQREGFVHRHPAIAQHVWNLVAKALDSMGYGK